MNSELADDVSARFAERLKNASHGDLAAAITLGYQTTLGRPPSTTERAKALDYLQGDLGRVKGFAWLLLNLDEFLYVR